MKIILFANTDWYIFNFRIELAKILKENHEVIIMAPENQYAEKIRALGFRFISIKMERRKLNVLKEFMTLLSVINIYKTEKPDLVHHFTIKPVIYGGIAVRIARIKYAVHAVAGMGFVFTSKRLLAIVLKPILSLLLRISMKGKNSRLILQNQEDLLQFTRNGLICKDRVFLIRGSGVNTRRFSPATVRVKSTGVLNVLLATRLLWDKGVAVFIEAARNNNNSNIKFLIAGDVDEGNPASVPSKYLAEQASYGYIRLLGHVDDMAALLRTVDVVVLPTTYGEGVPRVLLEAASSGLPAIATDISGCREIIQHNENGYLIQPGDWNAILYHLNYLANNPNQAVKMGQRGREIAIAEYEESAVIMKTIAVYDELIMAAKK